MNLYTTLLLPLAPECIVVVTALMVLAMDLLLLRGRSLQCRVNSSVALVCAGCVAALISLVMMPNYGLAAMLSLTPLTQFLKLVLLGLTILTAIISLRATFTRHVGEFFVLLLLAAAGLMLLISSDNLLMIFAALELLSVSLYVLTAFDKRSPASAEAALKYFLFGGMSAAFALFGISLLYGITGEIRLGAIAASPAVANGEPVFYAALVMTLAAFAFKLAAAPFHFWAPDVYEGAPAPVASFVASGSKVAAFVVLARLLLTGFGSSHGSAAAGAFMPGWMPVLAVLAVVSMVAGNLAALAQTSVRRLLAYSAVANAGYALLALFGTQSRALPALLFYVITYAVTVLGAFSIVAILENGGGRSRLVNFAGLHRRAPVLAFCMLVFMLSLAGIPPLSGFFGKFYVFVSATAGAPNLGLLWLVILAVAMSAVSLYYYLQVLKQVYAAEPPVPSVKVQPGVWAQLAVVFLAATVVVLGCAPGLLLSKITEILKSPPF